MFAAIRTPRYPDTVAGVVQLLKRSPVSIIANGETVRAIQISGADFAKHCTFAMYHNAFYSFLGLNSLEAEYFPRVAPDLAVLGSSTKGS